MISVTTISGGYNDKWISCDTTFSVSKLSPLTFSFFLPNHDGRIAKDIYVTDGVSSRYLRLERGIETAVAFTPQAAYVRVLSSYPEALSGNDIRQLGVVVVDISIAEQEVEIRRSADRDPNHSALIPLVPHYWIVHDYLDKEFYKTQIGTGASISDLVTHYIAFGWRHGFDPSSQFESSFYLKQTTFDPSEGLSPFVHYLTNGRMRGLTAKASHLKSAPSRFLSHEEYADKIFSDKVTEFLALIGVDTSFLRTPRLSRYIAPMFDAFEYRRTRGLGSEISTQEVFIRYILFDYSRGVPPGPLFDPSHYSTQVRYLDGQIDIAKATFRHWIVSGIANSISPTPLFEAQEYLRLNPDLQRYPNWLFEHWILHGLSEGRQFDPNLRIARNRKWDKSGDDNRSLGVAGFVRNAARDSEMTNEILKMRAFRNGSMFRHLVDEINAIDPNVGPTTTQMHSLAPPVHDEDYASFISIIESLPEGEIDALVLMPFCKLGGADFVAGVVTGELKALGFNPVVLRTEQSDWERPDWFPSDVASIDISQKIAAFPAPARHRALYEVIRYIRPKHVVNVNSRLAFETFEKFGSRLKLVTSLYCYYFCSDWTADGHEAGYPVWHFASILPHLAGAFFDTRYLADTLIRRHALTPALASKLHVLYTPAMHPTPPRAKVEDQLSRRSLRERPCIIWAGRFDRQKRFDLLIKIAKETPEVDFRCWGKAVLDVSPDVSGSADLPENLEVNGPFEVYEDLPLEDCDGWLYTSAWDGMPTIVIEIAKMGMPIVASGVGGIPELIDVSTGWTLRADATVADYVAALREMIDNPTSRHHRAHALQSRTAKIHSRESYRAKLLDILRGEPA